MKTLCIILMALITVEAYGQALSGRFPREELITTEIDLSLNKLSLVRSLYPGINGSHICASIKEQRFDSTDIDIRGRYFNSHSESLTQSTHASIIATMFGGGGNSSSFSIGAAPGVHLCSSDFSDLFPGPDAFYRQFNISVQNHSYGTGIENFYGADAASYDSSVFNNTTLVHVFSSGNSGDGSAAQGNYAGITGYANLTGSFKMAKNIITVGSVDSFNTVAPLSSRGPAFDGRIKPELVAFGEEGSSGAAALVSGTVALLQDAYFQGNGFLPPAALIKAVLLATADRVHGSGPSYLSGFGSMNAYRAMNCILSGQFAEDVIQKHTSKTIPLVVPANISSLKITLCWTDPPATANSAKALINDLDARLLLPSSNESWLPWVLTPAADMDSLQLPARRKTDTLNNSEQITIDHPAAGNYILEVNADKLITGEQSFAVAYSFDTVNNFTWSWPCRNNVLLADRVHVLRWQSNITGLGTVEYSLNNGPWQLISDQANLDDQFIKWTVPDTLAIAILRMTSASVNMSTVSAPFTISRTTDMNVVFNCTDSFMLQWNALPGKTYQVYQLGGLYLEPVATTTDAYIVLKKQSHPSLNYCVAPVSDTMAGLRSNTINYTDQGTGCYFQNFFASLVNTNTTLLQLTLGGTYGISQIILQKKNSNGFRDMQVIEHPVISALNFLDSSLVKGINTYRVALRLQNGGVVYSDTQSDFYFPKEQVIIFPNPVSQRQSFRIIADEPGAYSVNVYDVLGKLIYSALLADIDQRINASLPKGIYFIRINDQSGKSFTKKLVVY